MFFNHNKEPTISLYKKRINWVLLSRLLKWILSIICLVALLAQWKTIQKHELAQFNIIQSPEQLVFTYINTKRNVNSPLHVDYLNNKMK